MRILIVEDHYDTRRWLQLHLEDLGHQVFIAEDVGAALEILNASPCDVLISDIALPDGTGWELLEQTKTPPQFAIAMSGLGRTADEARSRQAGFRYHLYKPFPLVYLDRLLEETA